MKNITIPVLALIIALSLAAAALAVEKAVGKRTDDEVSVVVTPKRDIPCAVLPDFNREIIVSKKHVKDDRDDGGRFEGESTDETIRYHQKMYAQAPPVSLPGDDFSMPFPSRFPSDSDSRGFNARLMIMYRLVEHLDLDEEKAIHFFPIYLTYNKSRDKMMREHRNLIREIVKGAEDEKVPVAKLKNMIADARKKEQELYAHREDFLAKSAKILNDRQYVKLVVFDDKLKEDLIKQFRSANRREETPSESSVQSERTGDRSRGETNRR